MVIKFQKILGLVLMLFGCVTLIASSASASEGKSYRDCFKLPIAVLKDPPKDADQHTLFCAIDYFDYTTGDKRMAFQRYLELAKAGYVLAQTVVGQFYQDGTGVEQDIDQALFWLLKAAEQGDEMAQNNYGFIYFYGKYGITKDRAKALIWLRKAADQGDASSQTLIAEAYENGDGLPQDYKAAFDLYRQAAKANHIFAQYRLGYFYQRGYGTTVDNDQAFYWYERSANKGLSYAQFELGRCYLKGLGVKVDNEAAYMWFYIASKELNDPVVRNEMQKLEAKLSPDQIKRAISLGDDFIKHLADNNRSQSAARASDKALT